MSPLSIEVPFPVFQGRDGQPLENGYVWIGVANLNPQTNPVIAYFDKALTIPAAQPLRTINGYISNAGTPAQVYVNGSNFSILVQDSRGSMVYNFPEGTGNSPEISVKDFGAIGNGIANDTAAFQNFFIAGGGYVPPGDYLISEINITNKVNVVCSADATIKRNIAPNATSYLIQLSAGSEYSTWFGGVIDGQRAVWKSIYNGYGTANLWFEIFVNADNITVNNLVVNNSIYAGFVTDVADNLTITNIITNNCSNNAITRSNNSSINGFYSNNADNDDSAVFVRGLTINTCKYGQFSNITCAGVTGDVATPSGTNTVTGFLCIDLDNCNVNNVSVTGMTGDIDHLAVSIVRAYGCNFSDFNVFDYAGTGVELLACDYSNFDTFVIDAFYRVSSYSPVGSNVGMIVHFGGFYPLGNRGRTVTRTAQPVKVSNGQILRCGIGVSARSGLAKYQNVRVVGSTSQGWKVEFASLAGIFTTGSNLPDDNTFVDCEAINCGLEGISLRNGNNIKVIGGNYSNNGQSASASSAIKFGAGYTTPTNPTTLNNLAFQSVICTDTQNFTVVGGATFQPGNTTQTWPNNPLYIYPFTLISNQQVQLGQYITIVNGGGSNWVGQVLGLDRDEATVGFTTPTSFTAAGNTIVLTGTWTGSGTSLTGVGTLAVTELSGPYWVTDGIEYRQVISTSSNTSVVINAAFTTPLSGSTLTKLSTNLSGIPSQQFGVRIASANVASFYQNNIIAYGNLSNQLSLSSLGSVSGTILSIAESFRSETLSLADDTAIGLTPPSASAGAIISDKDNTVGVIAFSADASPSIGSTGSAQFATTTGVLTGTTGADTFLTASAASDGKLYIENRRGSSRSITVLFIV